MGTIFISHSEKDLATVNEIIRGLEQAGYRTWHFERDILPGTSYLIQITEAVAQCDAVVLVISSNSISSDQTTKEVVGAFESRKPFFPILLDMTPPQLKESQPEWASRLGRYCHDLRGFQRDRRLCSSGHRGTESSRSVP